MSPLFFELPPRWIGDSPFKTMNSFAKLTRVVHDLLVEVHELKNRISVLESSEGTSKVSNSGVKKSIEDQSELREQINAALELEELRDSERKFLNTCISQKRISEKQIPIVEEILERRLN